MIDTDSQSGAAEAGIDGAVVERAAGAAGIEPRALVNALVVLHAELIGRHGRYERAGEYVTVDGRRAYRIDDDEWAGLLSTFDFETAVAAAVEHAHTEQAKLLFARSVEGDDAFDPDEAGVVIGIDTAEQY